MEKETWYIKIKVVKGNLLPLLEKMKKKSLTDESLSQIFKSLFKRSDFIPNVCVVKSYQNPAFAGELIVSFEPSNALRNFSAAFLTGDFDSVIIKHKELLNEIENRKNQK